MKVLFLARATLYTGYGGDTMQINSTAKYLRKLGVEVDVRLCNEVIDYSDYDLIHVFNAIRPADSLRHLRLSKKPYVVSSIFLDFRNFEKVARTGMIRMLTRMSTPYQLDYLKTVARYLRNGERIQSPEYWWLGQKKAMRRLLRNARLILPNSHSEYRRLEDYTGISKPYRVIYNGIDPEVYQVAADEDIRKDEQLVICVGRIEGNKNQLNLIRALNNTRFKLKVIGKPAPNHLGYYEQCKREAAPNVELTGFMSNEELTEHYRKAIVHVLPSFSETCGLTTLEACYHQCRLVVTREGDTEEYFGDEVVYCNPLDPDSILKAVEAASIRTYSTELIEKINSVYTWEHAAAATYNAYQEVLGVKKSTVKTVLEADAL